jgi:hypothetical protein
MLAQKRLGPDRRGLRAGLVYAAWRDLAQRLWVIGAVTPRRCLCRWWRYAEEVWRRSLTALAAGDASSHARIAS